MEANAWCRMHREDHGRQSAQDEQNKEANGNATRTVANQAKTQRKHTGKFKSKDARMDRSPFKPVKEYQSNGLPVHFRMNASNRQAQSALRKVQLF